MKYARVKDEKNLIRDMSTQAILNTDISAVKRHEQRMQQLNKQKEQQAEINNLKSEISEIRKLLQQLIVK